MRYLYVGPLSSVSFPDGKEVLLFPNQEVELEESNEYVKVLLELGYLKPVETYTDYRTAIAHYVIFPSEEPLSIKYEMVFEKGKRYPKLAFCDFLYGHTSITDARYRVYKSLRIYDDEVAVQKRNAVAFLNHKPLNMPPFNVEMLISIRNKKPSNRLIPYRADNKLTKAVENIRTMQSIRDRIYLDTKTKTYAVANGVFKAGDNIKTSEVYDV